MASPTTWSEFKVDLGQLHHAIGVVKREHDLISDLLTQVSSEFDKCRDDWNTPAAVTFDNVKVWLTTASADLNALLFDMVRRMQTAYDNYRHTEEVNALNLESGGKKSGSHDGGDDKHVEKLLARVAAQPGDGHGEKMGKLLLRSATIPRGGNGATEGASLSLRYLPDARLSD
ncbi:WXG100 family type VII secretion target [Actinoallomurus acaciae]|uniref:WXG100 family type VII secretion target n=1 Tax=Actinoallomurus acaciae TaxID=502577 RepID=A0ABV5YL07_9ACTN